MAVWRLDHVTNSGRSAGSTVRHDAKLTVDSLSLSVACVTERGMRQLAIVSDGAAHAPAAPGVVADVWDSHANVLSNRACMSPQRWPPQGLVACCCSLSLSVACVTERVTRELGIVSDGAADAPAAPDVSADV